MAGYIFNLDNLGALGLYVKNGAYSTIQSVPHGIWKKHHESTLADYITMKAGDNVYFFIDRMIFGIGELVNVCGDCKFSNFPGASHPQVVQYADVRNSLIWDEGDWNRWDEKDQRWICFFRPAPQFFRYGVDMDELLSSNPEAFKMLRAFLRVSFLKFDDVENQAFKDVILTANEGSLASSQEGFVFPSDYAREHERISSKLSSGDYKLDVAPVLAACAEGAQLRHEMALEAGILAQLARGDPATLDIFGEWDYLSHQVIASPLKPVEYMDRMDIFGYGYIRGYSPTRSRYLVIENKKGTASWADVEQLLRYVDWVKDEYCHGNYSMIEAFLVARQIPDDVVSSTHDWALRQFTVGRRPAVSLAWDNIKLIEYTYDPDHQSLRFEMRLCDFQKDRVT